MGVHSRDRKPGDGQVPVAINGSSRAVAGRARWVKPVSGGAETDTGPGQIGAHAG